MPYRLNPKNKKQIQVKRGERWIVKYTHRSIKDAKKQLYVLNRKVDHK